MIELGGFQQTADMLRNMTGKPWSRQGVYSLWKRRQYNGFPELTMYSINGKVHMYFHLRKVQRWYDSHPRSH